MSSQKPKSKKSSKNEEIVEYKPMTRFEYPKGVLKALRSGKQDQVVAELIWRHQRKEELEDKSLQKLNRVLERHIGSQKSNDSMMRRIKAVLNKGDKKDIIKLILDIEVKKAVQKGKIQFQEPVEMWKEHRLEDLHALNIKQINNLLEKHGHEEIKKKEEKEDAIEVIIKEEEKMRENIEGGQLPFEEVEDFEYKMVPAPDLNLPKEMQETRVEKLVPVMKRYYIIPGIEQAETDEVIRLKRVGDMLLAGHKMTDKEIQTLSPSAEYKLALREMDIEKLADLFYKSDLEIKKGPIADYIEALLEYADIEDPSKAIHSLEQEIAVLKGETKKNKIALNKREVHFEEEGDVVTPEEDEDYMFKDSDDEGKDESEEEEVEDDQDEGEEGGGEYIDKLDELKKRLKGLEASFKTDMQKYKDKKERAEENIKSLEKKLKKNNLSVKKVRHYIIKALLKKEEDMLAKKQEFVSRDDEDKGEKNINPYNKNYPKFKRVRFTSREGEKLEGTVLGFAPQGVDVSVVGGRGEAKIYKVAYKNPSLKRVKKVDADTEPQYMEFDSTIDIEDLYLEPVSKVLRTLVVDFYVAVLKELKGLNISDEDYEKAQKTKKTEKRKLKPMKWDEFWRTRYDRWKFNVFKQNVDIDEELITEMAEGTMAMERDEDRLLGEIIDIIGEDNFTDQISAADFAEALKKPKLTPLEAYLLKNIGTSEEADNVKGHELMLLIAKTIKEYLHYLPRSLDEVRRDMKNVYIHRAFLKYSQKKDDTKAIEKFLKKHEKGMKKEYEAYKKAYIGYEMVEVENVPDDTKKEIDTIKKDVERFEEIAYNLSGGSVAEYLRKIIMPYLFLEGSLSIKANVFKAKVKNGSYEFGSLNSANLAHYLPEFAVPNMNDSAAFELADSIIEDLIQIEMDRMLDLYLAILDPSKRSENTDAVENSFHISAPLRALTKNVAEVCKLQSGTGQRPVIKNGKYVYKTVGFGKDKKRVQVMESIPDGDLVMCYDKKDKKFQCFDSQEVLRDIKRTKKGKSVKSATGYTYPADFIEKLKGKSDKITIPEDAEEEEEKETVQNEPVYRQSAVKRRGPRVPVHIPSKVRVKNGDFKDIDQILLVGDQFDLITLFSTTLDFEGADGLREIPITTKLRSKNANVVVFGFNVTDDIETVVESLEDKFERLGNTMKKQDLYLIGAGPANKKERVLINSAIKESDVLSEVKRVFYANSFEEEDIIDSLVNVVIDVEGPDVVAPRDIVDDWAYRADTPPLERKLRKQSRKEKAAKEEAIKEEKNKQIRLARRKAKASAKTSVESEEDEPEYEFKERVYTSPVKYGKKAEFTAAEKKRWRKMMERDMKKPAKYTKADLTLQNMEAREAAKQADPLLRAALIGDVYDTKKYLKTTDDEDVVEVYRMIQEAKGSKDVLKILRNDPRIKLAALSGDLEILNYLVQYSDRESAFNADVLYKLAKERGSSEAVLKELRKYPAVKIMLKEQFDKRQSKEKSRRKR